MLGLMVDATSVVGLAARWRSTIGTACAIATIVTGAATAQTAENHDGPVTVSSNVDVGGRRTQFLEPAHDAGLIQWDGRVEWWLPASAAVRSWGPYLRVAGVKSSKPEASDNAWLGGPGLGFQVFPVSTSRFQKRTSVVGRIFGPARLFAEYNRVDYWGAENVWRPKRQFRGGLDYWKALHVNDPQQAWWLEHGTAGTGNRRMNSRANTARRFSQTLCAPGSGSQERAASPC